MRRYHRRTPPPGARLVHNFYPGPDDDPARNRAYGADGFRFWVTDSPNEHERRCYCGWLGGREHYGTRRVVEAGS